MTLKETCTAAILGIVFGIALGMGVLHIIDSHIDTNAIQEALHV